MLRTEEEAKKFWCPFARTTSGDERFVVNRVMSGKPDDGAHCIASECMAWRKQESAMFASRAEAEFRSSGRRIESTEGFCGLAGKPA